MHDLHFVTGVKCLEFRGQKKVCLPGALPGESDGGGSTGDGERKSHRHSKGKRARAGLQRDALESGKARRGHLPHPGTLLFSS